MTIRQAGAVVLSVTALLSASTAQERDPKQDPEKVKAAPIRAMRLTGAGAPGTPPTQEELQTRFAKKLEGAWLKNADWVMDFDQAREHAKASGKQIFAYFTRSYAP